MFQNILYFIIVSLVCIGWGLPLILITHSRRNEIVHIGRYDYILAFFFGLSALSVLCSCVSIVTPIQFRYFSISTLVLLLLQFAWLKKKKIKLLPIDVFSKSKLDFVFVGACILILTFLASGPVVFEDTDLYHIQSIKWTNEYGTVPGVANLYLRFGFYSSWFQLISLFYLPLKHQNFLYLNLSLAIWFLIYLFHQYKAYSNDASRSYGKPLSLFYFVLLLYMLLEWDLFRVCASSTTYDFIISCITIILIDAIIKAKSTASSRRHHYGILMLAVTAPLFKLTGIFILILLFCFFMISKFTRKEFIFTFCFGVLSLAILVCKNYLQTGYPFYPYTFLSDYSNPVWKVPVEMVERFSQYLYLSNHYINQPPPDHAWVDNKSFSYIKDWFLHLTKPDQVLVIISSTAPFILFKLKNPDRNEVRRLFFLLSICYTCILIWLIASPDTRFLFGILIFAALFPLCLVVSRYATPFIFKTMKLGMIALAFFYFFNKKDGYNFSNTIYPVGIKKPTFQTIAVNGKHFHTPDKLDENWNKRCYGTPLPCTYQYNPYLQMIGNSYEEGFYFASQPDSNFVVNYYY